MKAYYVIALVFLLTLIFYNIIYSLNFSLTKSISINANIVNDVIRVNGNCITISNVYNLPVIVNYGDYTPIILYPGGSASFHYQSAFNYVILKANGFEEIIEVNENV
ncbi:hypothetical protein EWF20_09945 [Sulfolobus sp. S-194]|uniref:hypothetical protein n=1 Tax=Sulfolobus sp. S-194 TaxID=2512240 RepID=UPI0014371C95|nr:hypothetical protein [Sulfolobus sp. S-194]QIW24442.1 hypothetical protein EWF20_09945 [Sulfolobus sp. S-194]